MIAPTWKFEFELRKCSYLESDVQDYVGYIIKHEILHTNPPIHIYINQINNRLALQTKDGYKLKLKKSETIKLFGSMEKLTEKTKNGQNVTSL